MDKVALDDVLAWLRARGADADRQFGDDHMQGYTVTRGKGATQKRFDLRAVEMPVVANGKQIRTEPQVEREDVAKMAVALNIKDPSGVLGQEWKLDFPAEAEALGHEVDPVVRNRRGSKREAPGGEWPEERERDGHVK
jgi:hypothetical protein